MSQILKVSVPAPNALHDYDALRGVAWCNALISDEQGVCLVLLQIPETDPIQVVVNLAEKEASIVLPLPSSERSFDFGTAFRFPGGQYIVTEQPEQTVVPAVRAAMPEEETVFIVRMDRESAFIKTGRYVPGKPPSYLPRSAEAAAAAAMVLHRDLTDGTMESTIGQPGGILEIGLRKQNGAVTGLSAGGPVEMKSPMEWNRL